MPEQATTIKFPPEVGTQAYNRSAPLLRIYGDQSGRCISAALAFETALIVLLFQLDFTSRRAVESAAILSFEVNHGLAAASCDRARFGGDHRRHVHLSRLPPFHQGSEAEG